VRRAGFPARFSVSPEVKVKTTTLRVGLQERSYEIILGQGLIQRTPDYLEDISFPRKIALITNTTVEKLYLAPLMDCLTNAGYQCHSIILPDGEAYKNLEILATIYDQLIAKGFDRGSGLIALGGGVVGDMAGFAAATFLRGIPFVQIPTTLLAQVDSSVGGKTGINHPLGKNLIGAFYQPKLVLIDINTLQTLDTREVRAGLAEVVKYGVIHDADFFAWLEGNSHRLQALDPDALLHAVKISCQTKANIVEVDEREGSIRALLNFGHTFGHAIENLSGYGEWRHGEAVACGMLVACRLACHFQLAQSATAHRLENLLRSLQLPTKWPDFPLARYVDAMQRDKKVRSGSLTLVLNQDIGAAVLYPIVNITETFHQVFPELEF